MNEQTILSHLQAVERERQARLGSATLARAVTAIKAHQAERFANTYADLLASPRYAQASGFFLNELYGTRDFAERDAQFARIVPAIVRLFPQEIVATVARLAQLHALSEGLDTAMGQVLTPAHQEAGAPYPPVSDAAYAAAWQAVGQREARHQQVALALQIGQDLDRLTARPLLRRMLKLMRGPASAAGLADLQRFLESGFDTFANMRGAAEFLRTIEQRELAFVTGLFSRGNGG